MISGKTTLIAHLGYPTEAFKAPMIYNPWFDKQGHRRRRRADGRQAGGLRRPRWRRSSGSATSAARSSRCRTRSSRWALVDEVTPTARIAGACNAILKRPDGTLLGDQFDGAGFVRGVERKGRPFEGTRVLVSGTGGVGSAIAASLAAAGAAELALFDVSDALGRGAGRAPARALSAADGRDRLARTRPASTSSSTPRRWA